MDAWCMAWKGFFRHGSHFNRRQNVVRTKAVRRIGEEWDATLVLGVEMIPSQVFCHRQVKPKQTILPLQAPARNAIDDDAEAVRDYYVSEGYSPSAGDQDDEQLRDARTWEEAGLENPFSPAATPQSPSTKELEQGGGVPITPMAEGDCDLDVDIPSSSTKHAASGPLPGERTKAQKMDDDPVPVPKMKASRTDDQVNQIEEVDMCHNDENMYPDDFEDDVLCHDSEDEYIAGQGEGDGPPDVSGIDVCEDPLVDQRKRTGKPHTHWLLKRCLPGQRNAALRWHQHIGGLCEEADLEAFPGAPTILRHKDINRKIFVNIHVDDILLVCNPGDVEWFQQTVGATLTMKLDGPYLPGSGKQLMYLKKRMTMRSNGILIQPNSTYIPKLVALMQVHTMQRWRTSMQTCWWKENCLVLSKQLHSGLALVWHCTLQWIDQMFNLRSKR
eukprot:s1403_g7.t1